MTKAVALLLAFLLSSCSLQTTAIVASKHSAPEVIEPSRQILDISDSEKQQIKESVPRVLQWASTWNRRLRCPGSVASEENEDGLVWKSRLLKIRNSEVSAQYYLAEPRELIIVEIPELAVAIPFELSGNDLRAQMPEPICRDHDPSLAICPISLRLDTTESASDARKGSVEDIARAVGSLVCSHYGMSTKDRFSALIPKFHTDDPAIYVPVEMRSERDATNTLVFWLNLSFDLQSKKLDASLVKTISLQSEVDEFRRIARSLSPTERQFQCSSEQLK